MKIERSTLAEGIRSAEFNHLATLLMRSKGQMTRARAIAETDRHPTPRAVQDVVKSAVAASDLSAAQGFSSLSAAFVDSLRQVSVFDAMLGSMVRVPVTGTILSSTTAASGTEVDEGQHKPVSRLSLERNTITRRKAVAITVISNEQLEGAVGGAMGFVGKQLRNAVAAATDSTFLAGIRPSGSPDPAIGSTGPIADLAALLNAVTYGADSALFLVMAVDVAKQFATATDTGTGFLFPGMTPTGGTVLGMPALVTNELASGEMMLIDATAIVAAADPTVKLDVAKHASLKMDDAPASGAGELVSLWQTDCSGIRCERYFGFHEARDDAVAIVTGINY